MRLEVFQHGRLLQEVSLQDSELWVGRDDSCKIKLDDRAISRKHALIRSSQKGGLEFEKISEFGWVKLNGQNSSQSKLKAGDRLEFGSYEIRVSSDAAPASAAIPVVPAVPIVEVAPVEASKVAEAPAEFDSGIQLDGVEMASSPIEEFSTENAEPALEVPLGEPVSIQTDGIPGNEFEDASTDGATKVFLAPENVKPILNFGGGNQYEIVDEEIAIGRSQQCHVVLEDRRSSRKHSLIKREDNKYIIKDLGSANGTLVNGERVDEQQLHSGDEIQIGDTKFTFEMVQSDYEIKKQEFISVPPPEMQMAPAELMTPSHSMHQQEPMQGAFGGPIPGSAEPLAPSFEAPKEEKKSLIGKMLDRYRAMTTKQQIIYGIVVLAVVWLLMEDDPEETRARLNTGVPKKQAVQKKDDKKGGPSTVTFEMLTPDQKRYIDAQYQLAFELYKNREYDTCLLEVGKIFSLVQDYKNAREIEAFAKEGKRKMEAQEEERKRKEQERQTQLKIQSLIEQIGHLMDQKKYKEAEALFPEIELLQPENVAVSEWRRQIMAETEKLEKEREARILLEDLHKQAWADFNKAVSLESNKKYYEALDRFDEILTRKIQDQKLIDTVKSEITKVEQMISSERDPLLAQGKQLEQEGKLSESYRAYQKALEADPMDEEAPAGMKRIKGILTDRAKHIYTEGVFAESYGDLETAEKKYREVLEVVPKEDEYYDKADSKLKKLTVFKRAGNPEVPAQ